MPNINSMCVFSFVFESRSNQTLFLSYIVHVHGLVIWVHVCVRCVVSVLNAFLANRSTAWGREFLLFCHFYLRFFKWL